MRWSVAPIAVGVLAVFVSACQSPPTKDANPVIRGFSWVIDNELAAMPKPRVAAEFNFLADQEIRTLVSLTITPVPKQELESRGIVGHHIPVADLTAPTIDQMREFVELIAAHGAAGERIGVHCTAGLGRSGTMAAANFVYLGLDPGPAISEIRRLRPGSIETIDQEQAIYDFAESLTH